ncbi:MAG: hypothetical protein DRJ01_09675 [Bacteroidetes bacterium]|nr:MAG: hypothetical protein DRJ01_09675 [Bacteroidota bacterium]
MTKVILTYSNFTNTGNILNIKANGKLDRIFNRKDDLQEVTKNPKFDYVNIEYFTKEFYEIEKQKEGIKINNLIQIEGYLQNGYIKIRIIGIDTSNVSVKVKYKFSENGQIFTQSIEKDKFKNLLFTANKLLLKEKEKIFNESW